MGCLADKGKIPGFVQTQTVGSYLADKEFDF
jgi:hypothetical protein